MASIADIRTKFPMYKDLSDQQLLDAFHDKYYSDVPKEQFYKDYGLQTGPDPNAPTSTLGRAWKNIDDTVRVSADAASRGYLDKLSDKAAQYTGPVPGLYSGHEQEDTKKAWENLSPYVSYPASIISSIAASPYKIESAVAGGLKGAGEGFVDTYGHQKNWIPQDFQDVKELAKGTAVGGIAGLGGYGIAKAVSPYVSRAWNWARQPYRSDDALEKAIQEARTAGKDTTAAEARLARVKELRDIQQTSADERLWGAPSSDAEKFGKYMEKHGDNLPVPEKQSGRQMMERANREPSNLGPRLGAGGATAGGGVGGAIGYKVGTIAGTNPAISSAVGTGLGTALGGTGGYSAGKIADQFLNRGRGRLPEQSLEDLISMARDPQSVGKAPSPGFVSGARDMLSKLFIGGAKRYY